jgi:3'(2'), 5'-bisphosphate nucleotidase
LVVSEKALNRSIKNPGISLGFFIFMLYNEHMKQFLEDAYQAALKAKEAILSIYQTSFHVDIKSDASPVTEADKQADAIIRAYLMARYPSFGFLTEESIDDKARLINDYVWLVDPVDGTKDFIHKNDEFTINIALIHDHHVLIGLVMIPVTGETYYALQGQGAYYRRHGVDTPIHVNDKTHDLTVLTSRFHLQLAEREKIAQFSNRITKQTSVGSAIKACWIAHGFAEISYRLSPGTKEWDTAASDLIVTEAGGFFLKPNQVRYTYNREDVRNLEGYLIVNRMDNFLL